MTRSRLLALVALLTAAAVAAVLLLREERAPEGQWSIGILVGDSALSWHEPAGVANPVLRAADVSDRPAGFVADPFMIREGGIWYLFHEVWNNETEQGDIGVATSPDGRSWTYVRIVLDEPFHLSYPQVFACEGAFWMVPESRKTGELRLYRAEALPGPWSHEATLLRGEPLGDPTLFRHEDLWWMFAAAPGDDTLHLFLADRLAGPWREHPQSPVVRDDPHGARPAGRVLTDGDLLLRFAQDDAPEYGARVWAFEILELSPETYRERPAGEGPVLAGSGSGWNRDRMHHIDPQRGDEGAWIACADGFGTP